MLKEILKKYNLLFLIGFLLILPSLWGMIHPGFPLTDDGNWMVIRFSSFYESLRDGQFPVRFLSRLNNGFGYPVANFLYPLFMYIGTPIHILGANFVNTIKILFLLSIVASYVFAFKWLRKKFDNIASIIGALLYTLFPYHLFDIYKRGSVGEALSLSILPFVLWQIERKSLFFASFGIALIVIAHNTLALFFIPLVFLYAAFMRKNIAFAIVSTALGLGISSFFLLPATVDLKYVVFAQEEVSTFYQYFVKFDSFNILGMIFILTLVASIIFFIAQKGKSRIFVYFLLATLVITFFILPVSEPIWKILPFKNLIQFPFRLISVLIPLFAFQIAFILNSLSGKGKVLLSIIFVTIIYLSAKPHLVPSVFQYLPDTFYSTNQGTTTVKNEYMPKWAIVVPTSAAASKVQFAGDEKISIEKSESNQLIFNISLKEPKTVQINTIYYPGWEASVNGVKTVIITSKPEGLISLRLKKGQNNVRLKFGETEFNVLSDLLSIFSFCILILLSTVYKGKIKKFV